MEIKITVMNRIRCFLLVALCLVLGTGQAKAQPFVSLMDKYATMDEVVTVSMSSAALNRMAERDDNPILRKFTGLRVISLTAGNGTELRKQFLADVSSCLAGYEGVYEVSGNGSAVQLYVNGAGTEAAMLAQDDGAVVLMIMSGEIDDGIVGAIMDGDIRIK